MDLKTGDTRLIIDACKAGGLQRSQTAYVLATAWHETAHTMKPIYERGAKAYFNKYEPGTKIGKTLGNAVKGDGYLFRGRGYVQLTGRTNYARAGREMGVDLLRQPDLALLSKNAARIIFLGMVEGWFTGKKLADYITLAKTDFKNARRIINGTDDADLIAGYAKQYDTLLIKDGYGATSPLHLVQESPVVLDPVPVVPDPPTKETIEAAQKRLADLGYNPGGIDGKAGPLTRGAVLSFKNDNGLTPNDTIDEAFLTALATASPRKMPDARANATVGEVAAKVPEARVHWWNRLGAAIIGGGTTVAGGVDYIAPATGYLQPLKDFVGDVPPIVWIGGVVALCAVLYAASQYGANKSKEAFNAGDRR